MAHFVTVYSARVDSEGVTYVLHTARLTPKFVIIGGLRYDREQFQNGMTEYHLTKQAAFRRLARITASDVSMARRHLRLCLSDARGIAAERKRLRKESSKR